MAKLNREEMNALYNVFRVSALEDQRSYYRYRVKRNRDAARQVNMYRAFFSLLTGLASALAGLFVSTAASQGTLQACDLNRLSVIAEVQQAMPDTEINIADNAGEANCGLVNIGVPLLLIVAVMAPAIGAAFTTLGDLYQWDRLTEVYDAAMENLEVADAQSPLEEMGDDVYWASLLAYTEGTLSVMRDETAQWGQLIKTPEQLQKYVEAALERTQEQKDEGNNSSLTGG